MGREGNPYRIPLAMSKEMALALVKMKVMLDTPEDFSTALKAMRLGLIKYGTLGEDGLRDMYIKGLIKDDEVQFLLENKHIEKDFRPVKVEALLQAKELNLLDKQFTQVLVQWDGLKMSAKMSWLEHAKKYPSLPNARRLVEAVKEEAKQ